jgi:hypothetical protein
MSHEEILETSNPDKEVEYFWYTFKDSVRSFLNEKDQQEIDNLSEKLNTLQEEQKYEEIELYIKSHLEDIGYKVLSNDNAYRAGHLMTNFKRWDKISKHDVCEDNNKLYTLLRIYILQYDKKTVDSGIAAKIVEYTNSWDEDLIDDIMIISIQKGYYGIIDMLKNIINIERFIKEDSIEKYRKMTAPRSMKILHLFKEFD